MNASPTAPRRTLRGVSWGAWLVAVAALAAAVVLQQLNPPPSTTEAREPAYATALWLSAWVGFGLVGALITTKRSDNRIGWFLVGITFATAVDQFSTSYATYALVTAPGSVPFGSAAAWLGAWTGVVAGALLLLVVLTYPTGRPTPGFGRWLVRGLAALTTLNLLVNALEPGPIKGDTPPANPLGVEGLAPVLQPATEALGNGMAIIALLGVVHGVRRFRRSSGAERLQFRWFVYTVATFPVLFQVGILLEEFVFGVDGFDPVVPIIALMGNGLAAAIYVAISRHGLYEIDRVVNRTVVYAAVTASLLALYGASVVVLQGVLRPVSGTSDLAVAASTLAVAAAFGPVRRRIQSFVDRRFDRARYDASLIAQSFGQRLRSEVDLDQLQHELRDTVSRSVQPRSVSLWSPAAGAQQ